jgi:hypothetical protein
MNPQPVSGFLRDLLRPRATDAAHIWLDTFAGRLRGDRARVALLEAFTAASRRAGKQPIVLDEAERRALAAIDPELSLAQWTVADIARAWLLVEANAAAGRDPDATDLVVAAYEEGDSAEQQSWLRALPVLPAPERFLATAIDTCRTNILPQFEAIACENPYPARFFPEPNFNQLVLKALFNSIPMARIVGLDRRLNRELSRMASDYVAERVAAGRSVPPDISVVI